MAGNGIVIGKGVIWSVLTGLIGIILTIGVSHYNYRNEIQDGGIKANQEAIMKATSEQSVLGSAIKENTHALDKLQMVINQRVGK